MSETLLLKYIHKYYISHCNVAWIRKYIFRFAARDLNAILFAIGDSTLSPIHIYLSTKPYHSPKLCFQLNKFTWKRTAADSIILFYPDSQIALIGIVHLVIVAETAPRHALSRRKANNKISPYMSAGWFRFLRHYQRQTLHGWQPVRTIAFSFIFDTLTRLQEREAAFNTDNTSYAAHNLRYTRGTDVNGNFLHMFINGKWQ